MTGQGYDYTTVGLLHHVYFINYYNMIAVDLIKQQALDADLKAIQQINYTRNLDQAGNNNVFHCWRSERNHFIFLVSALWIWFRIYFALIQY